MLSGLMYVIMRPGWEHKPTDLQNGEKLRDCDRQEEQIEESTELIEQKEWQESQKIRFSVLDSIVFVVCRDTCATEVHFPADTFYFGT